MSGGPPQQWGISAAELERLRYEAKLRAERRHEYMRDIGNPHRFAEGGILFDPAWQRYLSAKACRYEYFKATPKSSIKGILATVPFFVFGTAMYYERKWREHRYRTGQVAYKDRPFKFV